MFGFTQGVVYSYELYVPRP
ncbi:unnamed protein product [Acanthoscelides obtectus]|uniref:Uncharacterized protein n=1 Tax=Acanthoscelides obtectus TaxID=200917 RepID=A0A9P0LZC4_ACAOB|nr:unnamed protein product [Acanthoscelides obtectus]CAK1673375.1 hypothetical protein AOBTE_LOCUS29314 [Acanthoscelides obtectus]